MLADPKKWEDGTFVEVAKLIGGSALELVFLVGAAISTVGLLCTLLSTTSRINARHGDSWNLTKTLR